VLEHIEHGDRIEALTGDDSSPIAVEICRNPAELRMIGAASALCVVHYNMLIDYSEIDTPIRVGQANRAAVAAAEIKQLRSGRQGQVADEVMQACRRGLDHILPLAVRKVELGIVENFNLHEPILASGLDAGKSVS
jgi:hypothetical protein